ncbi:MAG: phosphate signaling complex PhoU family protein [Sulfolobales archaeon]
MRPIDIALERIREKIREMTTTTESILSEMSKGLSYRIEDIARYIDKIRLLRAELHSLATETIARYQPVASDLRYIIASLEISYGLFRFSRYALDIAYIIKNFSRDRDLECDFENTRKMLPYVVEMVRESIESFMNKDTEKANKVIKLDSLIDQYLSDALKKASEKRDSCTYLDFIVAIYLERIADHSVYIASDTIFMI